MRRPWVATFLLVAFACARPVNAPILSPTLEWISALSEAQRAVEESRFDSADAVLANFANRRKGTPEAREATYWRAVFLLHPKNRISSIREAALHLDEYLAESPSPANVSQARALRGMAVMVDSLDAALRVARQRADSEAEETAKPAVDTGREEELQKEIEQLKEQLEKANAELDRIKKRLTAPRPPG